MSEHCIRRRPFARRGLAAAALAGALAQAPAQAALTYSLSIDDPLGAATGFHSQIESHVGAALFQWGGHLSGSANLELRVDITREVARAAGNSFTSGHVGTSGGRSTFEQGMAYELRTGNDPNGAAADVHLLFNPDYLGNVLWFDSDPYARKAPANGSLPADYASPWDINTRFDGQTVLFTGANAQAANGGPVPITAGNNLHLGNLSGPGSDLVSDAMSGVVFNYGNRYGISALDLAMLRDMGVAVASDPMLMRYASTSAIPELQTWALWLGGLALLGSLQRRRRGR